MKRILVVMAVLALALAASARVPDKAEMSRVSEIAQQMDIDADEAYVEAVYAEGDEPTEAEIEALQKLYVLKESASDFNSQVAASYEAPEHTLVAFERLNNDYIEARACFADLKTYPEQRELFETIEDNIGNMRYYYVSVGAHVNYPDFEIYPYYPGLHLFAHVYAPDAPYHYRHVFRWHLHPKYYDIYPHRHAYRRGYGRHKVHFAEQARHHWHRRIVKKTIPVGKPAPAPKPKPGPGPGSGGGKGGKGKGR